MLRTLPCALSVGVAFAAVIPIDLTHSAQEEHRHSKMSVITENALVGIAYIFFSVIVNIASLISFLHNIKILFLPVC